MVGGSEGKMKEVKEVQQAGCVKVDQWWYGRGIWWWRTCSSWAMLL